MTNIEAEIQKKMQQPILQGRVYHRFGIFSPLMLLPFWSFIICKSNPVVVESIHRSVGVVLPEISDVVEKLRWNSNLRCISQEKSAKPFAITAKKEEASMKC